MVTDYRWAAMSSSRNVGVIKAISRYPVKSMQGESLTQATIGTGSLEGDRAWGVINTETGYVVTAKRTGELLNASAELTPRGPLVRLPEGMQLNGPSAETDAALSNWLAMPVSLQPAPTSATEFQMSFNVDDQDSEMFAWATPAGSFLDLAPVHVLTTAALAAGKEIYPSGHWSAHRFRPTILIDTGTECGFIENGWVGGILSLGDVQLDVTLPTMRCSLPTKPQAVHGIESDLEVFKSLAAGNNQNLGAYTTVRVPGTIKVGDEVTLSSPN